MAAVTYRLLFGTMPLRPTYIQLQMADQTFREVKGTVADVLVKIDDHFVYADFQVIDMGEDEYDPPIILGRPFLSTVKAKLEKSICTSSQRRYAAILLSLTISLKNLSRLESDATATRGGKLSRMDG